MKMKFSNFLFAIALTFEVINSEVIKNNAFSYNFHCSNSSLCRTLKRELSNAVNSISSLMDFSPVIQFEAVVDDISKYREDTKKEILAVALDKDFVPLDSVNSNIKSPYPGSEKIMNEISSDIEDNDFILVLNNFEGNKKGNKSSTPEYRNIFMKVIIDSLSSIDRLEEPYRKKGKKAAQKNLPLSQPSFDNNKIIELLETRLNEIAISESLRESDSFCENQRLNKLYTIFHWKNRLISKGNPAETAKYPYKRVVAVGDIHGDYEKLIKVLRHAKLINRRNNWIARDTILIQVGDLFDRGDDIIKILDLLFKLRDQAKSKRSVVYLIYGNHEINNIKGNYSRVSSADMNSFKGVANREEVLSVNGKYGKILRKEFNVTMTFNDSLFIHSGLTPEFAEMGIENMNTYVRDILTNVPSFDELLEMSKKNMTHPLYTTPILDEEGPLDSRSFVQEDESTLCPKVEKTLELTNTKRMIVGHNVIDYGEIITRCDGKVIYIDIGLGSCFGNYFGYLEFLNDKNEIWAVYN